MSTKELDALLAKQVADYAQTMQTLAEFQVKLASGEMSSEQIQGCFGSAGTFGCMGGCFGSAGTFGCYAQQ